MTAINRGKKDTDLPLKLQAMRSKKGGFVEDEGTHWEARDHCMWVVAHMTDAFQLQCTSPPQKPKASWNLLCLCSLPWERNSSSLGSEVLTSHGSRPLHQAHVSWVDFPGAGLHSLCLKTLQLFGWDLQFFQR